MRKRIFFLVLIILQITLSRSSLQGLSDRESDFNVLLITIDTIRPDRLSCYSTKYLKTPHIDSLASRGVLFEKAFAHNPMTLPSHVNILLGTTPLYHGVHENSKSYVAADFLTLAEYLKDKGYATGAFIGAFPLDSHFGLHQGFDVYDESYPSKSSSAFAYAERKAEKVIQSALDWLKKQSFQWFAWIHLWDPHAPYLPPKPYEERFKDDPYSGEVVYVDTELGKIFDYLESSGLMEKTLLILTGDHGESLGEHGELTHSYFAYNSTLWVPLIIAAPGQKSGRIGDYVCHVDIFPTVCDILGIEKPSFLQGVSLLPLMKGKKIEKKPIYFESLDPYYNRGWAPLRGFIEDKGKFMDSPLPEYYSLEDDFNEENNIVQKVNLEKQKKKLKELMDQYSLPGVQDTRAVDRETQEKLRSLGYIVSPVTQVKESYGPEDDLKTLFPIQRKHTMALTLYEEGQTAEAVKLLNEIIQERNDFDKAYIHLSRIYKNQGLAEEALGIIEEGYKKNPENYSIISSYGVLLVKEGKVDKGIEVLQKGLAQVDYDPEVWTHLGIAYWKKGDYHKALEHYERALALDSTDALVFNNMGTLFLSLFIQTKKGEDHARSVMYFKRALSLDPDLASAYNGLGGAYKIIGENDNAIAMWEKALELQPDFDFPLYNLGVAYLGKGNKARALEYFKKYLVLKKDTISPLERREVEGFIQKCR